MVRPKYYTPNEVSVHNTIEDLWVSFLGKVYNLTPLCDKYKGDTLLKPILQEAGRDISHWFNKKTKEIRTHVDPITGCVIPYTPHGRFIHIPPPFPSSEFANDFGRPWWKDDSYCIGILSHKTRFLKIINTLTSQEHIIESENLDMKKNLSDNGIEDESEQFYDLGMSDDQYLPAIHLYFNDDLTES